LLPPAKVFVDPTTFIVLTSNNTLKFSEPAYLIKHDLASFLKWHCEIFSHSKTITSQTGRTGNSACGNKSQECNIPICACPTDINLPKAKNKSSLWSLRTLIKTITKHAMLEEYCPEDGEIIACGAYGLLLNQKFLVDWNILRRCNFTCTYCPPDIHDLTIGFPPFEQYQKEFSEIEANGKQTHFTLNGGEPTLHPNILDIVKMCKETGTVEILSNGTAPINMYNNLLKYAKVTISLHHELINEKHMKKFIDIAFLGRGTLTFKYFNTFDLEKFGKYLHILNKFDNVGLTGPVRISSRSFPGKTRGQHEKKQWLT
tara:strand:+ start:114 stop:1058 length:945 start_codon:yes stop_codon:yes gene_type:complete